MADNETNLPAVQQPAGAIAPRPAWLKEGDTRGTETIGRDDIQVPRLALAQGLTPEVAESKEGFSVGVFFNSVTKQTMGKGPIRFAVLRVDRPRYIQFRDRNEGGGIIDMNVPANDPRTRFRQDPKDPNKSLPPVATMFRDYIVALLPLDQADPMRSVISLSLKSTGLKVARGFNTAIKFRNAPLFAGAYVLTSITERNTKGVYAQFKIENDGWVEDEPTAKKLELMYDTLKDKKIDIDRTQVGDDAIEDFPFGANAPAGSGDDGGM